MYLAPLNFDRFFERVFRDPIIAQHFLEAILDIKIESIELLPRKNKITDDAAFVEFDFRCKINGKYVIVDMQQAYKSDVVKRFYLYFCTNTSLQSENIPTKVVTTAGYVSSYKTKDYNLLEPSITIIWMANDPLGFTDDIVAYALFPEMANDFIRNEALWSSENLTELLENRQELLKKMDNNAKSLDFLSENRLIFAFQANIVRNKELMTPYYEWFDFAQKTRNKNNKESDFSSFKNKPVFMKVMEKLRTTYLETDDLQYLEDNEEFRQGVAVYQAGVWREAREEIKKEVRKEVQKITDDAQQKVAEAERKAAEAERKAAEAERKAMIEAEIVIEEQLAIMAKEAEQDKAKAEQDKAKAEQDKAKAEQDKAKAEQDKAKAEQDKAKAEQELIVFQMRGIRKFLEKGNSLVEIADFMGIDMQTLAHFVAQIKAEDDANNTH